MKGKLIVIEGLDGSGKQTQTARLRERLEKRNQQVVSITFPNYQSDASLPIKMYLNGEFGEDASNVNPYMASTFYAVDRIASFKTNWEKALLEGKIILADRYTTSNMIHQGSKLSGAERDEYLDWLLDFEYNKLKLPRPDLVIYLDMPFSYSHQLREKRTQKFEGKDIHEQNEVYLKHCHEAAKYVAERYGWTKVSCVSNEKIREIDDINNEILSYISQILA